MLNNVPGQKKYDFNALNFFCPSSLEISKLIFIPFSILTSQIWPETLCCPLTSNDYFKGINFRGDKPSLSPRAKINFRKKKLSRMVPFRNFASINFRERMKFW